MSDPCDRADVAIEGLNMQIPLFKVLMAPEATAAVGSVLESGHIAQGAIVDQFEQELHHSLDLYPDQTPLTVNSGTSALHLAMHLAGVGPGDDVCITPMTCAASVIPIVHLGARPIWIDVDPVTGLMDPKSLQERITPTTKAIVTVDWAGTPCDYEALHAVKRSVGRRISVVQDAAHAMFARDAKGAIGRTAYERNHYICWSLQAIKTLTTGDGGILLTQPWRTADARLLRWFGLDRTSNKDFRCAQDIVEAGYKFHMNDIAAAIGLANLAAARSAVERHRANAKRYCDELVDLTPLHDTSGRGVVVPPWHPGSSWWIYTILVDDRVAFQEYMQSQRITTSQVHRRNDEHTAFRHAAGKQAPLPGLDQFASRQVSIPVGWWVSDDDATRIIAAVREWARR